MHFTKNKKSIDLEKQLQLVYETRFHHISTRKERKRMLRNRKKRIQRIKREIEMEKVKEKEIDEENIQKITSTLEFFEFN
jgi:hypothetical protein